ncbi:MAG: enoyl-CoA hydratase [Parvibaculum sp.]|jgi:enoyl-CoA hydratase/carnithine racemase|uniref:enoyl-CoA hydratase/isomerase family protein n=1 Tax=Parvibaculum sp. TaxID=2024848 RepID=UPI0035BA1689
MDYSQIKTEKRGNILLMTLNRPDRLNAWTPKMAEEQADAIQRANDDPDIGAIVMTGEGRGFCAGADISDTFKTRLDGKDPGNDTAGGSGGMPAGVDWIELVRSSKPMIAAVNGPAVGIGVTMILPFDVIVAAEEAKFGMVFVKMGIVPELASSHFLVSRMGWGHANEMMLSGRLYGAAEAREKGLCEYVVPGDKLLDKAFSIAAQIAENPSRQLRMTKELLTQNACTTDLTAAQKRETDALKICWTTPEHHEAVDAFLNKRKPDFKKAARNAAE